MVRKEIMRRLAEQAAISARFYRGDTAISLQEAEELFSYINQGLQAEMNVHKQSIRTELFQLARDVLDGKCSSMTPTDASQEVIYHHIYVDDIDPKVTAAAAQWGVIHTQENKH
ncbi:MAG: hypothetical protein QG639_802, partial [Patescibacteria group bacterium]|nr:hypothetical protein [Patescibacteria group bacterium]